MLSHFRKFDMLGSVGGSLNYLIVLYELTLLLLNIDILNTTN